jgi:hypothetical protein
VEREEGPDGEELFTYRVVTGDDPFGYSKSDAARLLGEPHSAETWLTGTASTEFPDMVVQLAEFFDSPRSPDVYLTPKDGFGFRAGRAAGHGSLARREMVVPLLFAGPGIQPGTIPAARTIDIAPTILRYLGVPFDPAEMDGDDLGIERPAVAGGAAMPPLVLPSEEDEGR